MLVLARRVDEGLEIDGGIVIRVLGIRGGCVRLAVDAPADVRILRQEVAEEIRRRDEVLRQLAAAVPPGAPAPPEFPDALGRPGESPEYYAAAWDLVRRAGRGPSHNEVLQQLTAQGASENDAN